MKLRGIVLFLAAMVVGANLYPKGGAGGPPTPSKIESVRERLKPLLEAIKKGDFDEAKTLLKANASDLENKLKGNSGAIEKIRDEITKLPQTVKEKFEKAFSNLLNKDKK